MEEERRKKEEEKNKRQQMNFGGAPGGRNFVIPTKVEKNDKFGNIVQAKQEMANHNIFQVFLVGIRNGIPEGSSISPDELKAKIKELHHRICKLETDKYDLEKRHERQEYDLKELNERSRQVARNSNGNKVADSSDSNSRFPVRKTTSPQFPSFLGSRSPLIGHFSPKSKFCPNTTDKLTDETSRRDDPCMRM
ncbi:hypothetical protein ANCCEY_11222 [Ancylostoma ceylanicum]|uniref:Uncharacterized protein n=1 Tax=Ancylostoma ceylanicum TaxID=53326 RepID=A0A0D6LI93_9BILA|nr:hypothetical protein ANCCEY_11222 [Ancylostoma ceylanicum]